jgi:hypothetical protein
MLSVPCWADPTMACLASRHISGACASRRVPKSRRRVLSGIRALGWRDRRATRRRLDLVVLLCVRDHRVLQIPARRGAVTSEAAQSRRRSDHRTASGRSITTGGCRNRSRGGGRSTSISSAPTAPPWNRKTSLPPYSVQPVCRYAPVRRSRKGLNRRAEVVAGTLAGEYDGARAPLTQDPVQGGGLGRGHTGEGKQLIRIQRTGDMARVSRRLSIPRRW